MTENSPEIPAYDIYWKKKLKSLKDISYSRDGNYLLVGSNEGRVYFFEKDGTELWQQNLNDITCLGVSGDASRIITGNNSGSLCLISKEGRREWEKKVNGSINSLSISDDGKNICIGTDKGIIFDFNDSGNELWKHKIKGTLDGGICHSPDGKFIAVGSWDTVHLFSVEGKIIWKFKFNKKITNVSLAEKASLIAACTKGSIGFIGNEGNLISEKAIANGFKSASICDNRIYAISSNNVYIFNNRGEQQTFFEAPESLLKIYVNSKEFISAISENRIYMFSSLMKPEVNILTESLIFREKQPLKVEVLNNSPKDFELELELRSNGLTPGNFKSLVKVPANGKSNAEFLVAADKIGKCNIEFFIKNKNIKSNKNIIEVVPPKIELNISHHPKYEFNAEDDEITMIIDIENNGQGTAKKIGVVGDNNLFLPELKPEAKTSLTYKIKLPSGEHNLSKNIIYEDEFDNKFNIECSGRILVEKAPYVWGLKQPVPKITTGKTEIIKFDVKNIKKDVLNLIFNITSEKIEIKPDSKAVQLKPSESQEMEFSFMPRESGENIEFSIIIEYDGKIQKYENDIKVYAGPPHIIVKNHLPKDKYLLGEEIYETLELLNDGESAAKNIQIDGIPEKIPILEPKILKLVNRPLQSSEAKSYRSEKNRIKYEDDVGDYSIEFDSKAYTVQSPALRIKVPEINLQENIKKEVMFEITNVSNELMKGISVELSIPDDRTIIDKRAIAIETISPNTTIPAVFHMTANKEGIVDFSICAKHQGAIIAQQAGTFIVGSKTPALIIEADDGGMVQNEHSLLKLKITNTGEMEARDISIKIHCEIDKMFCKEVTPSNHSELKEIKPYESKVINLGFYPENAGRVSLIIRSFCKSIYGKDLPEKRNEVICTIRPQAQKAEKQIIVGGDYFDGGGTKIKDAVVQKCSFDQSGGNVEDSNIQKGISGQGSVDIRDSIVQRTSLGDNKKNIEKYRALCIQAFEDGKITMGERDFLNNEAIQLGLSESEKRQIEDDISRNKGVKTVNIEAYRKQAFAVFRKGKITQDERGLLDVSRFNYGLNRELQKQIENEILAALSKDNIIVEEEKFCPNCGKIIIKGTFCGDCGRKAT